MTLQRNTFLQKTLSFLGFSLSTAWAYFEHIHTLVWALFGMWVADFITGYTKCVIVTKDCSIRSHKLRWSFAKLVIYVGLCFLIFFVGDMMQYAPESLFSAVKLWIWCCVYAEGLSIVENLLVIFPMNKALLILHWFLSVKFLTFIPKLADYLKDKKEDEKINNDICD